MRNQKGTRRFVFSCAASLIFSLIISQSATAATGTVNYNNSLRPLEGFGAAIYIDSETLVGRSYREAFYDYAFTNLGLDIIRVRNNTGSSYMTATSTIVNEAIERNPNVKILLTPWSPPANLKEGSTENGGTLAGGPSSYNYTGLADWWADSIENWASRGVVADYVSIQNEPDIETSYDSCIYSPTETTDMAGYDEAFEAVYGEISSRVGSTISSMPKMIGPDSTGYAGGAYNFPVRGARDYIDAFIDEDHFDGFSFHMYSSGDGGAEGWETPDNHLSDMNEFVTEYGYKPLHMTEYVHLDDTPSFDDGWKLAWHMHNALYHLNVSAYYYWTLFRNSAGGMIGITSTSSYTPRDVYRFFKAYSYFTDPDWYILDVTTNPSDNMRMSAFRNPANNKLTVVVLNKSATADSLTLNLNGCTPTSSAVYRSSETQDWASLGSFSNPMSVPAYSITTITFDVTAGPQQTLNCSSTTGGSVTTPGEGNFQFAQDSNAVIVATADQYYHFVQWTGSAVTAGKVASPTSASTTVTMDADYTLIANFAIDQRTLTSSSTDGGNVTTPGEGAFSYDHGTNTSIVAAADTGYHFVNWTGTAVTAGKVASTTSASTTLTMDNNYTVVANFAVNTVTRNLNSSSTTGGSVTTPGEGNFNYDNGTAASIVATADTGYHFVNWTGTAVTAGKVASTTSASTTVTIDADYTVIANFETNPLDIIPPTPSPITWTSAPTTTGSTTITMTATAATDVDSPPVQYYFECTNDASKSSSWQTSNSYTVTGLNPSTLYSFRTRARDSATVPNETEWSSTLSATTEEENLQSDTVFGNMMLINDNGNWCWYQDDKIIYDPVAGNVIISTAAEENGFGGVGGSRLNDMDATTFNIATGQRTVRQARDTGGGDDHNMGGLWIRPDGRYLHMYCPHYTDQITYYRLATNPNDGSAWGSEQSYNWETISGITDTMTSSYTNVYYLTGEGTGNGRLYNIHRIFERTPCISYSDDWGQTWQYMGRLNGITGTTTYSNFYHKFRTNGVDRIDFIGTEQHPRNYNNSIYHGYIKGGKSYNSYGVEIDTINDQTAPSVQAFTPVFTADPTQAAGTYHTGWTNEIELDAHGYPVCLFQTRYGTTPYGDGSGQATIGAGDHRFFYARFNGTSWTSTELGKMGTGLHTPEQDYLGMGCIHPDDVNIIYISTPFDPRDDSALTNHEIFKGVTSDNGLTWDWTQLTFNSTIDNLRPAVPIWDANNTAVFWIRGVYPGQENYDTVVVGMVNKQGETAGPVTYIDAATSNTTNADGSAFSPTGPSSSAGTADSRWHQYTGYGNGGSCFTAGDGGTENAPAIRTTITGLADGTYDVFAYFWCDPAADWGIRGGFTSSDLMCFNKQSSQHAAASQFSGSVTVTGTGVILYRVYIGRQTVSGETSIVVYLDNYDSTFTTNIPTRTTYDGIGIASVNYVEDLTPPTPDPLTWASVPTATGSSTISMTATAASDSSLPVQYYFECTNDASKSSSWQSNSTYIASGLTASTQYSFRVMARDNAPAHNETGWSSTLSATTNAPDTTPPSPNPMTWATVPSATGSSTITMTASTATDAGSPPVQYYFECTNDGTKSSSWQSSSTYVASGLTASTEYTFRVRARDSALTPNETGWSGTASATTQAVPSNITLLGSWGTGTSHTKESGTNRALIFIAHGELAGDMNLVSVTYGGQAMTKVIDRNYLGASGTAYAAAFILKETGVAAASTSTFTPTWSGTAPSSPGYAHVFLSNVNQTTSIGATGSGGSTSNPVTTSALATSNGDMVVLGVTCGNAGTYTLNNSFTEGTDQQMGGTVTGATGHKQATGANETPSATYSSTINRHTIIGFVVKAGGGGVTMQTLTTSATSGGTVTTPGVGSYQYTNGTNASIVATANANYHFVNWTGTAVTAGKVASPTSASTTVTMDADYTVVANFAINTYNLSYTAGSGGSITGQTSQVVNYGSNGTAVTAVANTGYHFVNWSDASTANPRTDTNVTANISVTANFAINTYSLSYAAGTGGSITGQTSQVVNYGSNGTAVTAVANTGYHFVNWSDASTANPRTDTNVTSNISVTANFAIDTFTLSYTAGSGGSITGQASQVVNYGSNGTAVTAVANTGYHFVNWSDASTANPRTDTNVISNITVTANFAIDTFTLSYTAGSGGSITGETSQVVNYGSNGTAVTAVANTGYHFVNWSDASTANPRTDTNVTANMSVTANFAINVLTLSYTASTGGSITGETSQAVDYGSNGTAVTAVPDTGYHFVDWSDASMDNPRTDLYVTANLSLTANFEIDQHTLITSSTDGGDVTVPGEDTYNYDYGTNASIVATADTGYHFVNWTGTAVTAGKVTNPASANTTVLMDDDYTVVANFEADTPDTPPAVPTGLTVTAGSEIISLEWNDNNEPDLAGYNVYRSTTHASGYIQINVSIVTDSNYIDNDVNNLIPYYYVVTAVDTNDLESAYSDEVSAMPEFQTCEQVIAAGFGFISDVTGDCYVDIDDLAVIVQYWLYTDCAGLGNCDSADLEPDGDVDMFDYSDFALDWLNCNNPEDSGCPHNW